LHKKTIDIIAGKVKKEKVSLIDKKRVIGT
jgi:hypothetical protein